MRRNRSPATLEAPALIGLMHLQSFGGAWDATGSVLTRALVAARTAGDFWAEAYVLDFEALSEMDRGNPGRCLDLAREARSVALRSTSPLAWQPLTLATRMIAYAALQAGRLDEAGRGFEEVIAVLRKHGDIWSLGILLTDLAGLRVLEGRHDDARACTQEAMSLVQSIRDRRGLGWCLQAIAMLEAAAGRARRAAWLYGAGEAMLEGVGAVGQSVVTQVQDRYLAPARLAIGEARISQRRERGTRDPVCAHHGHGSRRIRVGVASCSSWRRPVGNCALRSPGLTCRESTAGSGRDTIDVNPQKNPQKILEAVEKVSLRRLP